jgi:Uma2 family endonuclease
MRRKAGQYFEAGCKLLWLIDADAQTVEVWTHSSGPAHRLSVEDTLEAPELLPGFSMAVKALF